jgi:uncharacterized protein
MRCKATNTLQGHCLQAFVNAVARLFVQSSYFGVVPMSQDTPPIMPSGAPAAFELPALPAYVVVNESGVFIDPTAMSMESDFALFVDLLYTSGFRFLALRYALFQRLIHHGRPNAENVPEQLADAIVPFEVDRREIYKGVKIASSGEKAEYFFESVSLERIQLTPIFGPPKEDGSVEVIDWSESREIYPTELNLDEFVFDLWGKGVRYGIDLERVNAIIANKEKGRFVIAHMLAPEEGSDAGILEVFEALHRDNSPKRLSGGRLDLRQFKNRFPQIKKDVAILKKIPRTFGKTGITVFGKVLEPIEKPKDFNLITLSGLGTRVETREDGEYIVASKDGFLSLDSQTNQVSVTEKVINVEDVSLRTTGDLKLSGDDFENLGDVQEGRIVEGKHMSFQGDVYGQLHSNGGEIKIGGNIVKGKAVSSGGSISVKGRASQAELRAVGGLIEVSSAEGCVIIASKVRIETAHSCEIYAEVIEAKMLVGCAVAAQTLNIEISSNRRDMETVVGVLIPNLGEIQSRENKIANELESLAQSETVLVRQIGQLHNQPELVAYLALDAKLKKGQIKLSNEQAEIAQKAAQRFMPFIQKIRELSVALEKLKTKSTQLQADLQEVIRQHKEMTANIGCHINQITGETVVCSLPMIPQEPVLSDVQIAAIKPRLQNSGGNLQRLFSGGKGCFDWHYVEVPTKN